MANSVPFRLNRNGLLLALVSAAFAGEAGAAGGRVDFATDGATISGTDGKPRPLTRGTELGTGDTIRTDTGGRAQIRFPDGAYVSLQPNTEFSVKEYNFDGKADGTERSFFGLAKGAMRTVTGLIGRVNKARYQISTPTATIGIRGTGGRIEVLLDGSTLIAGTSGIWTLTNPSGTIDVPAGKSGKAPAAPDQPPQQTLVGPNTDPAPTPPMPPLNTQPPYSQGDNRGPKGVSTTVEQASITPPAPSTTTIPPAPPTFVPLVSGSGFAMGSAFQSSSMETTSARTDTDMTVTFDGSGNPTSMVGSFIQATLQPGGTQAEGGNTDGLAWGRWIGPVKVCSGCLVDTYSANQGFHYVIGTPTAVMPTTGQASYVLLGASSPTYVDGRNTPGSFSGNLTADFFPAGARVTMNLNVAMPDRSYNITGTTGTSVGALFSGTALNSFGTQSGPLSITGSGACGCTCSANVQGFFAGASAERAGLAYLISENSSPQIVGAAAFKKSP